MKAIIENGKINGGIQSCFIAEYGDSNTTQYARV
jgi:hypothetical protein